MKKDALTDFLDESITPETNQPQNNDELASRMDAMAAQMQKLVDENLKMKEALAAVNSGTPKVKLDIGQPYTGPLQVMTHPETGQEVQIKESLVPSALEQGFKKVK